MRAVIMAGGMGTRLASLTKGEIPKSLYPICGKPMLQWQVEQFKRYGIDCITMMIGHLGEQIREYFGDGSSFGVKIDYIDDEKEPLGTGGPMYYLGKYLEKTGEKEILLTMGDLFFDFDINRMLKYHREKEAFVTLLAHPNIHPYDSDLVVTDTDGRVNAFDSKHNIRNYDYDNCVNAGIYIMSSDICKYVPEPKKMNLEKDVIAPILETERVFAYRTPEFIRDAGTADRVRKTEEDILSGRAKAGNLENRQKAIFLDRDGTINEFRGFIADKDDFKLMDGVTDAIKLINSSGYLAIVVTNQPVIARGELTFEELDGIFNKMKTLLGNEGAYVDDIFFCPHHPDKGFPGEVPELKIECSCRKPNTGMLEAAAEKYNIDLKESWMVGDMTMDIQCGKNAECHTCLLKTGKAGTDGKYDAQPDLIKDDLLTFASDLLLRKEV